MANLDAFTDFINAVSPAMPRRGVDVVAEMRELDEADRRAKRIQAERDLAEARDRAESLAREAEKLR